MAVKEFQIIKSCNFEVSFENRLHNFSCACVLSALLKGMSCRAIQIIRADTATGSHRIKPHKTVLWDRHKNLAISDISSPVDTHNHLYVFSIRAYAALK